jgi:hypothetical protein
MISIAMQTMIIVGLFFCGVAFLGSVIMVLRGDK